MSCDLGRGMYHGRHGAGDTFSCHFEIIKQEQVLGCSSIIQLGDLNQRA